MITTRSTLKSNYEICEASPSPGFESVKQSVLGFVRSMKLGDAIGVYEKERGEGESFYGSYHALHALDLFGQAPADEAEREQWAQIFRQRQTQWGHFSSDLEHERRRTPEQMDAVWHYTRGNIWALRLLGREADYPLRFLDPFFDTGYLYKYVKRYDWSNSWAAGNQICAVATALQAARDWFGESQVDSIMEREMYPALEELIDSDTGYWGTQFGADIWNGQFGTIHVLPMYFTQGWPVRYVEQSVDTTLKTQLDDGSFWPGGSDCPDFDGAYMLLNLSRLTDYRAEDIHHAARKYLSHALLHQDQNGSGFLLHRRGSSPAEWKSRPHWIWKDGVNSVTAEYRDEDPERTHIMLGSWFYPLSIALVSMILGDSGYEGPYRLNRMSLHQANVVAEPGLQDGGSV